MLNSKVIYLLVVICIFPSEITASSNKNSFSSKPVNHTQFSNNQSIKKRYKPNELKHADLKCKYKCVTAHDLPAKFTKTAQARFIDLRTSDTTTDKEMETPAAKFSILNLLSDDEEGEDDYKNVNDYDESVKDEEVEDDDFSFFGPEEEINTDKPESTKEESFLKQYHRHTLRMHHWVFPLLLAYKLKFFMVIPFLLGSLVLLIGTTGVAGFFFALFAAALGIHVKNHEN